MLKPSDFDATFTKGRRIVSKPIGLAYVANFVGNARLGLAISKKAVPLAVHRNRLKRVIRDTFRQVAASFPQVDLVVYIQPGAAPLTAAECRKLLGQLWVKVADRCASR